MAQTVAALSSGLVPSGVAVIRVSGPAVRFALEKVAGEVPDARVATLRTLRSPATGTPLDQALVLFFPKPASFTGEDVAEFHCHGGRAVVDGVLSALWSLEDVCAAEAGDFTRQAFANGKLDLTQVEAVGDLIHASTAAQRDLALHQLGGAAARTLEGWRDRIAMMRAHLEADLDFSDEEDVPGSVLDSLPQQLAELRIEMEAEATNAFSERLRDGFRVVLAGAPNSGKSTLLNTLLARDAALVSSVAGTTRDKLDVPIDLDGLPAVLSDTAGMRSQTDDSIEAMGIEKARLAVQDADLVVWLQCAEDSVMDADPSPLSIPAERLIRLRSKMDLEAIPGPDEIDMSVSGKTGKNVTALRRLIAKRLRGLYANKRGGVGDVALDARRRDAVLRCAGFLEECEERLKGGGLHLDQAAEDLRLAQRALAGITGDVGVEGVLDRLFSRFCIGK